MDNNEVSLLAELDCFLDARLAVLRSLEPTNWEKLFGSWFRQRTSDNFERMNTNVSQATYEALYASRNNDLFQYMDLTPLAEQITRIALNRAGLLGKPVPTQKLTLDVNTYPYELDESSVEVVLACLGEYISPIVELRAVYYSPEELTPSRIRAEYNHVFMYDFDAWVEKHLEDLKLTQLPGVNFYIPKLFKANKTLDEITKSKERLPAMSVFDFYTQLMVAVFQLNYVDVSLYSYKEKTA